MEKLTKIQFILLLSCLLLPGLGLESVPCDRECEKEGCPKNCDVVYEAPGNAKYPFGDEANTESNMLDDTLNIAKCVPETEIENKCSPSFSSLNTTEIYVTCPEKEFEILYSSLCSDNKDAENSPKVECVSCSLTKNAENTAVIVECYQCFDVPSINKHPKPVSPKE